MIREVGTCDHKCQSEKNHSYDIHVFTLYIDCIYYYDWNIANLSIKDLFFFIWPRYSCIRISLFFTVIKCQVYYQIDLILTFFFSDLFIGATILHNAYMTFKLFSYSIFDNYRTWWRSFLKRIACIYILIMALLKKIH